MKLIRLMMVSVLVPAVVLAHAGGHDILKRFDLVAAQFEPIAAKAVAAALPAAAHPLGGAGAGDLGVCDNRGGDALAHQTAPLIDQRRRARLPYHRRINTA